MSINKLFGIALGFADKLRFSQKFIIIATLFVIPLTLLLSASVSEFNRKINHIMSQQQGLMIVDTLKENYKAINQARVTHLVSGSFDGEALVTEALGRLDQVAVQDPDQMEVIKQLKTVWRSEKEKDERISVASLEYLSNHYIQAFHSLGIRSKLKFDFEAERYFLADGLLHQLPELLGLFVQLQSKSGEMIKRGKFDPDAFVAVVSLQSKVANALKENNGLIAMLNTHAKHPFVHLTEKNDQLNTSAGAFMEVMQREVIDAERLQFKFESFKVYLNEVNNDLLTLYEQFYGDCLSMITENLSSTSRLRTGMFLLVGLALIFAACTIAAIYIAFKGNIDKLKSSTKAIATGRLDRPVVLTSVDEIGEIGKHFNTMRITIGELILQAKKTITSVRGSAGRIKVDTAKTGIELKAQESEVNEIANSMEVMSTFIEKIAKNTDETAIKSKETNRLIKEGEHVISSTIYSIQSIAEKVDETGKAIMKLADDSNAIGSVLEVIKTIAEQTNLLALNAAIEAARAGEQGRGFAVVADEVRSLATRTQRSTEEIQDMIEKIQQSAQHTVQVMEKGMSKAEEGSKTAEEASAVLKNMTDAMQQIVLMTDSIAGSIDNQKQMANDINQKTGKVAALSREINSHAQTTAGSAQEMNELVEKLDAAVGRFTISSL